MKSNEHSKQIRVKIIVKYKSEDGSGGDDQVLNITTWVNVQVED